MNTKGFFLLLLLATAVSVDIAQAGNGPDNEIGGKFGVGGGAAIGAVVAGPPGAIIGAGIGGFLGDRLQWAARAEKLELALDESLADADDLRAVLDSERTQLERMRRDRSRLDGRIAELEQRQSLAAGLELAVLFRTGSSGLDADAATRIERLAVLLEQEPTLTVRLDGYADPRGGDDYNLSLSANRAVAVRDALLAHGIEADRVEVQAHGHTFSLAAEGDADGFALERRVSISLGMENDPPVVAQER